MIKPTTDVYGVIGTAATGWTRCRPDTRTGVTITTVGDTDVAVSVHTTTGTATAILSNDQWLDLLSQLVTARMHADV